MIIGIIGEGVRVWGRGDSSVVSIICLGRFFCLGGSSSSLSPTQNPQSEALWGPWQLSFPESSSVGRSRFESSGLRFKDQGLGFGVD